MAPKHCYTPHAGFGEGGGEREGFELGKEGALAVAQVGKPVAQCLIASISQYLYLQCPALREDWWRKGHPQIRVEEEPVYFLPLCDSISFRAYTIRCHCFLQGSCLVL